MQSHDAYIYKFLQYMDTTNERFYHLLFSMQPWNANSLSLSHTRWIQSFDLLMFNSKKKTSKCERTGRSKQSWSMFGSEKKLNQYQRLVQYLSLKINHKPRLSPTIFEQFSRYTELKVEFHYITIRVRKEPKQNWCDLLYLATNDAIVVVLDRWLAKWHTTLYLSVGSSKSVGKQKKEVACLKM